MKDLLTGHAYEIQGLLYILASNVVVWRSEWWGTFFFWYGVIGIVVGLFIQASSRIKENQKSQ